MLTPDLIGGKRLCFDVIKTETLHHVQGESYQDCI